MYVSNSHVKLIKGHDSPCIKEEALDHLWIVHEGQWNLSRSACQLLRACVGNYFGVGSAGEYSRGTIASLMVHLVHNCM